MEPSETDETLLGREEMVAGVSVPLPPGSSLRVQHNFRIGSPYTLFFHSPLTGDVERAPSPVVRVVLWASRRLILNTSLVARLPVECHGPKPSLAGITDLMEDLRFSRATAYRHIASAMDLDILLTLRVGGVTAFMVNPALMWRGDPGNRTLALQRYQQFRNLRARERRSLSVETAVSLPNAPDLERSGFERPSNRYSVEM